MFLLGRVDTKIMRKFLSRISAQTRRENAGGLSPGKFSRRSMRKILPKRCVLGLVSTRPNQEIEVYLAERNFSLTGPTIHLNGQITEEEAINIIIKALLPSLKANNPKDARHGDGQYFTDLNPALYTSSQIARRLEPVDTKRKM